MLFSAVSEIKDTKSVIFNNLLGFSLFDLNLVFRSKLPEEVTGQSSTSGLQEVMLSWLWAGSVSEGPNSTSAMFLQHWTLNTLRHELCSWMMSCLHSGGGNLVHHLNHLFQHAAERRPPFKKWGSHLMMSWSMEGNNTWSHPPGSRLFRFYELLPSLLEGLTQSTGTFTFSSVRT